jgi:hypothetical protein
MRLLVTGSRSFDDAQTIWTALDAVAAGLIEARDPLLTVVHGTARGADDLADRWVRTYTGELQVTAERHPALWQRYGKRAGRVRNELMIASGADLVLAFIRDDSPGATHCAELASDAGIPLRVWVYGQPGVTSMDSRHLADEDVLP